MARRRQFDAVDQCRRQSVARQFRQFELHKPAAGAFGPCPKRIEPSALWPLAGSKTGRGERLRAAARFNGASLFPRARVTASDTLPVVTAGDAAAAPSQFGQGLRNADAIGPRATPSITINPHVNSSRDSAASALSQDLQSTDATLRDPRSLQERLAAIRQSADIDPPAPTIANATIAYPTAPPTKPAPSSRRVVDSTADSDETLAKTPRADQSPPDFSAHIAAPNKAASIDSPSLTGSLGDVSPVKAAIPDFGASEAAGKTETAAGPEIVRPESANLDAAKFDIAKSEVATAPRGHGSSRRDAADSDDKPSSSGALLFTRQSPLVSVETTGPRTIVIGKEATYVVTIKNSGDVGAQDLAVTVKIPEWTDVAGAQASAGTTRVAAADANEPFQWKIPRLEAHAKETLSLRLLPRKRARF